MILGVNLFLALYHYFLFNVHALNALSVVTALFLVSFFFSSHTYWYAVSGI